MKNVKFLFAVARNLEFPLSAVIRNLKVLLPRWQSKKYSPGRRISFFLFFSTHAQLQRNYSERELFESLNRERTRQGLSELQWG